MHMGYSRNGQAGNRFEKILEIQVLNCGARWTSPGYGCKTPQGGPNQTLAVEKVGAPQGSQGGKVKGEEVRQKGTEIM